MTKINGCLKGFCACFVTVAIASAILLTHYSAGTNLVKQQGLENATAANLVEYILLVG